ncbi:hypothetical protein [Robertmurraya kyonggiensis]|uniref:Uncharacterized protein n=1 Tax=Robertmurraya kyonggiensis TaxID=1037680 RepID=A0A4U1D6U7_9BACI|nr:hypothetical protein [Robertmurraya kyonggiensis]TKC18174.1 hypothetical protein FA727_01050 [Robertmurraya kyonggiensis]
MNKIGWLCLGVAGGLVLWAITLFSTGFGYYNGQFNEALYVKFMGDIVKVTTTEELSKYGSYYLGLSSILMFCAIFLYRKFLKIVPVNNEV